MPTEVSSQAPGPEQTMGGTVLHRAMATWISIPHQVNDASSRIRFRKQIKIHLMEQRDYEETQTHIHGCCTVNVDHNE